ncbi:MAG: Nramp family divalent metal transporter [Chloroflexi bacterium]|nr:Nramp family divalent metal transporter [Chloroflexota bacterium]
MIRRLKSLRRKRWLAVLGILGPGLISALAGDDAGGIGTYATAGAAYGYNLLFALLIVTVALAYVQDMSSRMGVVTGKGLSDLIREEFGVRTTAVAMLALLAANAAVTVSEFVGIAAAAELFGVSRFAAVPAAALGVWWLSVRGGYNRAERVFLILTLAFGAYIISALVVHPDWGAVARGALAPTFQSDPRYILMLVALIGTTISPYMQFSLQSIIVEKGVRMDAYTPQRIETLAGVLLSDLIAFFIIVATAATLHANGVTDIQSADQAAMALEPAAGPLAKSLFALGLLGASLLAASVLPLTSAYAICEAFGWERGLRKGADEAPIFYGIFTTTIVLGAALALMPGVPLFTLLVLSQDVNGILLPVILILMLRLANNHRLMGAHVNGRLGNTIGYGSVAALIVLTALLIVGSVIGIGG